MKIHKYLISYFYNYQLLNCEIESLKDTILTGTGCMLLDSSFKIETVKDIETTNDNLMNIIKLNDDQKLISARLSSFNLLKG